MPSQNEFRWQLNLCCTEKKMGICENNPMEGKKLPPLQMLFLLRLSAILHLRCCLDGFPLECPYLSTLL